MDAEDFLDRFTLSLVLDTSTRLAASEPIIVTIPSRLIILLHYFYKHKHYITNTTDFVLALKLEPIQNKKIILKHILEYYQLHIDGFGRIKSVDILENILST